ncbi:hypothetical protein EDE11_1446 [Methylomonas methanica]|uniref:Uncharacterized protein n=1 Tax=Methylomonas methanica TaxID=421 RepID=A0ABY2CFE5_METMH|nr:hypothetical protein EDE11_1446 [Methylomonas methanica]
MPTTAKANLSKFIFHKHQAEFRMPELGQVIWIDVNRYPEKYL